MAVSGQAASERVVRIPDVTHPLGYLNGDMSKPVYIDPVWHRYLIDSGNYTNAVAILANAIRTEVDIHHP